MFRLTLYYTDIVILQCHENEIEAIKTIVSR